MGRRTFNFDMHIIWCFCNGENTWTPWVPTSIMNFTINIWIKSWMKLHMRTQIHIKPRTSTCWPRNSIDTHLDFIITTIRGTLIICSQSIVSIIFTECYLHKIMNQVLVIHSKPVYSPFKHIGCCSAFLDDFLGIDCNCNIEIGDWFFLRFVGYIYFGSFYNWSDFTDEYCKSCCRGGNILIDRSIFFWLNIDVGCSLPQLMVIRIYLDAISFWNRHRHIETDFIVIIKISEELARSLHRNIIR